MVPMVWCYALSAVDKCSCIFTLQQLDMSPCVFAPRNTDSGNTIRIQLWQSVCWYRLECVWTCWGHVPTSWYVLPGQIAADIQLCSTWLACSSVCAAWLFGWRQAYLFPSSGDLYGTKSKESRASRRQNIIPTSRLVCFLCMSLAAAAAPWFFPIQIGIAPRGITHLFGQVQSSNGNSIFNSSESIQRLKVESTHSQEINSLYSLSFINTCSRPNA